MSLHFSCNLRLMSICDFYKWPIKTEQKYIERMKDSHYYEQADVFCSCPTASFH